ncbi:SAM-dependent methyltransferase [Janibacter limosus]|uniref:SAM-dependent methyltransferase n=1 Tax=Janibacter limosus TaxID=53458 RepID=A0AC61U6V8_9MICO|nr:SAM-dependent methyltransferase [Janibacter limosus]UUZ45757.1 SAM-dependent methyltransferase [Janibacter limosus]
MTDATTTPTGRVLLVGGGPGDPGLLTVAGRDALIAADVVITDRLAPIAAIAEHAPQAEVVHVGKIPRGEFTPQERINELLVEHARAGKVVVRLKGGDGYLFGRGGEEWQHCTAAGIPVEIVPGVSSAFSVPALAGIPVTHRGLSRGRRRRLRARRSGGPAQRGRLGRPGHLPPHHRHPHGRRHPRVDRRGTHRGRTPRGHPRRLHRRRRQPAAAHRARGPVRIASAADEGGFAPPAITVVGEVVDALGGAPG